MGKLFIVATPIGNLGDITFRAVEILKNVPLILAEDTRRTKILLDHYKISAKLQSFHEHSGGQKVEEVISQLNAGEDVALVSDAGTPNLCDPGGRLVQMVEAAGLQVVPIPGVSSLTTLISVAPFAMNDFCFKGYFPKKKGRQTMIVELRGAAVPIVFLESSHRIKKTLELFKQELPDFNILIGRELTKIHEEIIFCPLCELEISKIVEKGEFILALAKGK